VGTCTVFTSHIQEYLAKMIQTVLVLSIGSEMVFPSSTLQWCTMSWIKVLSLYKIDTQDDRVTMETEVMLSS
jgi:hypothetical protein